MIQKFLNRKTELEFLNKHYKSNKSELIILYGRRRVGKTELIKQFIKDKSHIYYLSTKESIQENINSLKNLMADHLGKDFFRELEIKDFETLFKRFFEILGGRKKKEIIVIDEFPFLIGLDKAILSLFQRLWDEFLSKKKVMLILTGSSVSIMETDVLGYKSPLYGRRTGQWKLQPFGIKELMLYFKNYSSEEVIETYFIVGGIPAYFTKFDPKKKLDENLKEKILIKGEFLYEEAEVLLRQEFREQWKYALILKKISLGYNSLGKLCSATGMNKGNLSKYLYVLENVGILKHVHSLGKRRGGIYIINDNYFDFWFRYVCPNKSRIEAENSKGVIEKIKYDFSRYAGKRFELLVKGLISKNKMTPFTPRTISKWWYKDKEIDIVALNEKTKEILFVECKWKNKVNAEKVLKGLAEKASYVDWFNEKRKESYAIFAKSFSKKIKKFEGRPVYCFDLKDLAKVLKRKS